MAFTREEILAVEKERVIDPRSQKKSKVSDTLYKWENAETEEDLVTQTLSSVEYLTRTNQQRIRQASVFSRLLSGKPLHNFLASNATLDNSNQLPIGRPTANVCYSSVDTLTSMVTQDKPKPVFLTDGGHYKQRKLAKEGNAFIQGELYRTKAYDKAPVMFRNAAALGDGFLKVFRKDRKVQVEHTLSTELLVDFNDGYYGNPRKLLQKKLVDRDIIAEMFPKKEAIIMSAVHGNVDGTPRSTETISDQIIVAEGWCLPSGEDSEDGRHVMICSEGVILDEKWTRPKFPFIQLGYNPNLVGFFSQGLVEILMPTQMEIYRMLIVESQTIELMGVPRIYIDELSKIIETSFNNRIGSIIKGRGAPPTFLNADVGLGDRVRNWVIWLINNARDMSGISGMAAAGRIPSGIQSGEAIREFDAIQQDRFAALAKRYQNVFPELSLMIFEEAAAEAKENGSYSTVHVTKNGTREIDFRQIKDLTENPVIQLYEESSLPKDPAGRQAKLSEMLAAGEITVQEFRRLSNFPDLEQSDQLAAALQERIYYSLDEIVENGQKNYAEIAPDPFMLDPTDMADTICVQYINRYSTLQLEPEKLQLLRNWHTQLQALKQAAMPPPVPVPQQPQISGGLPPGAQQPLQIAPPAQSIGPTSGVAV